jgi:hypothetical protein
VASANPLLHERVLEQVDGGMERLAFSFAHTAESESG